MTVSLKKLAMKKQLQLSIHEPCHENWDAMTPVDKDRFCGQCKKEVVDFTNMSDRQLAEFFKKPSSGSVCGRFMTGQLERDIEIPRKRIPWIKYFFQFALPAFLVSLKATSAKAQGQVIVKSENKSAGSPSAKTKNDTLLMPEVVINGYKTSKGCSRQGSSLIPVKPDLASALQGKLVCVSGIGNTEKTIDTSLRIIKGYTIDEKGDPLPGVTVRIKGTTIGTAADGNGFFSLKLKFGNILVASGPGLEVVEKIITDEDSVILIVPRLMMGTYLIKKVKGRKANTIPLIGADGTAKQDKVFTVYPNPVRSGEMITISCKKAETGTHLVQVLSISGQPVFQQEEELGKKSKQIVLRPPALIPGEYIVVLSHRSSGKKYSSKIIIQ